MWEINFKRSTVEYLTLKFSEKIRDKFFKNYSELETSVQVIFIEGWVVEFNTDKLKGGLINEIEAVMSDVEFRDAYSDNNVEASRITKMTCYF